MSRASDAPYRSATRCPGRYGYGQPGRYGQRRRSACESPGVISFAIATRSAAGSAYDVPTSVVPEKMKDVIDASAQWRDFGECGNGWPFTKRVNVTIGF